MKANLRKLNENKVQLTILKKIDFGNITEK